MESTSDLAAVDTLAQRMERLISLVGTRDDPTSQELQRHLKELASSLHHAGTPQLPGVAPAQDDELVLSLPPKLDLIEAIIGGSGVGRGETGAGLRPSDTATEDPVLAPDPSPSSGPEASALAGSVEVEAELEADPSLDAPDAASSSTPEDELYAADGLVADESEPGSMFASAIEPGLAEDMGSGPDPDTRSPEIEAIVEALAADAEALPLAPEALASDEDWEDVTLEAPPPAKDPTEHMAIATDEEIVSDDLVAVEDDTVPDTSFDELHAHVDDDRSEDQTHLLAIDEASSVTVPSVSESPWPDPSGEEPGPLGPVAEDVVTALEARAQENEIRLHTQDVLAEQEAEDTARVDTLTSARDEAARLMASLGATPGDPVGTPSDLEPMERLVRNPVVSKRPQSRAVAALPRHLAYEAMVAPLRVEPNGTLFCLVPEEFEPQRVRQLARTLERRIEVVEASHAEVLSALDAAYGPIAGVDQDALLLAISEEGSHATSRLFGRMSRWLRKT